MSSDSDSSVFDNKRTSTQPSVAELAAATDALKDALASLYAAANRLEATLQKVQEIKGPLISDIAHEISTRLYNCIKIEGEYEGKPITTLPQLDRYSYEELMRWPNFGRKCYEELWLLCVKYGVWDALDPKRRPRATDSRLEVLLNRVLEPS